jgi:MFS family permease
MTAIPSASSADFLSSEARTSIRFLNWAHAVDHYVMLIFPTVVIGLEAVYGRSYGELIALATASFVAFGVFSLPAGWLADHWSRRNIMTVFFVGCGVSLIAAGVSPNVYILAVALAALGMFAAIYHPVGMAMLIEASQARGRVLAFNGVCGNMGAALAAGGTAVIASFFGWRMSFIVPAVLCIVTGFVYLWMVPDDHRQGVKRKSAPEVRLSRRASFIMFGLFVFIALGAGLAFNVISVALPKLIDERVGNDISLMAVGGLATTVFFVGALAQFAMGRLVERSTPTILLTLITATLFIGVFWSVYASGVMLMVALAVAMTGLYGQVTVNDVVIARYTADAWRGRVYAVRYFLVFISSGAAVASIAYLHTRGGFDLVLLATAAVCFVFFAATVGVAILVSGVDARKPSAVPAE